MGIYFAYDYTGEPFVLFGPGHLLFLAVVFAIILWMFFGWKNPTEEGKRRVRIALAAELVIVETSWAYWNVFHGHWSIQSMLPFHLCSMMIWVSVYMLLTRSFPVFEFAYFLGIGGALQPLITPEAGIYGLPHFRAMQTLFAHGGIVVAGFYMVAIEGYRPTWASLKKVFIWGNVYMALVYMLNLVIGSNYMFVMRKPDTASLMDVLGPWPWYILSLEAVAGVLFLLMYLPYIIKDRRVAGRR